MELSHARVDLAFFFFFSFPPGPLIDRFKDSFSSPRRNFFSERALDGSMVDRRGWTCQNIVDSSVHCQAIFQRLQHPRGEGVLSGSTFRSSISRSERAGGQALTAQFHRRTPQGICSLLRQQVSLYAGFSSVSFQRLAPFRKKKKKPL